MKLLYGLLHVILFSPLVWAQQQGEDEFPIGVFSDSLLFFTNDAAYDTLIELGINYVIEDVSVNTYSRLQPFNVIASNGDAPSDVIQHYSNAIYSVWEAENDNANFWGTGFKHTAGIETTYNGKSCWSTGNLNTDVDSLLFGPYYSQEKKYHRLNYRPWWNQKIQYKVRYRIALEDKPQMPGNTEVCKLRINYVVNTYNPKICSLNTALNTTIQFEEQVLTLDDFPTDSFYTFEVDYEFPDSLVPVSLDYGRILYDSDFEYSDICPATGAEFALDWSGIGKLYIDYVDVVDPLGEEITDPFAIGGIQQSISNYLSDYYNWENLTYWYIRDEPHWLDCYLPAKIMEGWVNTLSSGNFHTITEFYPHWANQKNGDEDIAKYVEIAQPYKLMIDSYPFSENATEPLSFYLNLLRNKFQSASKADSNFWYVAQSFG